MSTRLFHTNMQSDMLFQTIKNKINILSQILSLNDDIIKRNYCELVFLQNYKYDHSFDLKNHHVIYWLMTNFIVISS